MADDPMMWVSHETIYKSLFVQGRGELRRELTRCPAHRGAGQAPLRAASRPEGRIPGMVMISELRPRSRPEPSPEHWEGDLLIGKNAKSAVGTLVERTTRYVMLFAPLGRAPSRPSGRRRCAERSEAARGTLSDDHVGPGEGDAPSRSVHRRHRHPDLLLRPPQPLAATDEREHQMASSANTLPQASDLSQCTQRELDAVARSTRTRGLDKHSAG